jgi:hypothetical protein
MLPGRKTIGFANAATVMGYANRSRRDAIKTPLLIEGYRKERQ